MTSRTFTQKQITLTIALGTGSFGETGKNTVTLSGLRASAIIEKFGAPTFNTATIRVYGVPLDIMNKISSLWLPMPLTRQNFITVTAGDAINGMPVVFQGDIWTAWSNLGNQPDASLDIFSRAALADSMKPVPPRSYTGPTDVAVIMAGLAEQMNLTFENNGVQGIILSNPYLPGTATQQALSAADAANINLAFDDVTLAIWPKTGSRGGTIPLISADAGMIGYPVYNGSGISVKTIYNPAIKFGSQIKVSSSITAASGIWNVWRLTHNLQAQTPGGLWQSEIDGKIANV